MDLGRDRLLCAMPSGSMRHSHLPTRLMAWPSPASGVRSRPPEAGEGAHVEDVSFRSRSKEAG
jgi:hypothetical protein